MPLNVICNDITKMQVDVIVNAANTELRAGGGVCGAIFSAAGASLLQEACDMLAPVETGNAVITEGYCLTAKYVIHAVGPVYIDGMHGEEELLRSCYANALDLAKKHSCESIAFPLISSGIYGYPKDEALSVATGTIGDWLMRNDIDVYLVIFDKSTFSLPLKLLGDVQAFINDYYINEEETLAVAEPATLGYARQGYADNMLGKLDEPFSATLLRLIDAKGKTDIEIYKRANLDRKLFSKIRTGRGYMPSKKTAIALAVALELSLPETKELLECAGFALSRSVMFDVIVEYFIAKKKYDIFEINNTLFEYDQQLLGG